MQCRTNVADCVIEWGKSAFHQHLSVQNSETAIPETTLALSWNCSSSVVTMHWQSSTLQGVLCDNCWWNASSHNSLLEKEENISFICSPRTQVCVTAMHNKSLLLVTPGPTWPLLSPSELKRVSIKEMRVLFAPGGKFESRTHRPWSLARWAQEQNTKAVL